MLESIQLFTHAYVDGILVSFVFAFWHHIYVIYLSYQKIIKMNFWQTNLNYFRNYNQEIGDRHSTVTNEQNWDIRKRCH